jgi:hypothetical protein
MKEAYGIFVERFDEATKDNAKALKELCAEVKQIKLKIVGPTPHSPIFDEKEVAKEILENEPIGWANSAIKAWFKSPAFWAAIFAIVLWMIAKVMIFGEYPAFSKAVRPYMQSVVKNQQLLEDQHRAFHEQGIPHVHNEEGQPIKIEGPLSITAPKGLTEKK